jgi:hypothetical protein
MVMMFETIQQRYQAWQERRFLRRYGCTSRAQYEKMYDPDHNARATRTSDYYHGYPYVYCFEDYSHYIYQPIADYGPGGVRSGHTDIRRWAQENCQDKVRFDFLRVCQQHAIGLNGQADPEWHINGIGDRDMIFVAFKSERDFAFFMLRWS